MAKGKSDKLIFKTYDQSQLELLPPTAAELIPENHLVRVVNEVIEMLDVRPLLDQYDRGGGASRYHPLMLLKVLVYSYLGGIYSSRKIAKALRENVYFMWLSGRQQPDFRTINTFRKDRLSPVIEEVFIASVKLLAEAGYVSLNSFFVDGTKIEANANRYSFVWRRAVDTFDKRIDEKLKEFLGEVKRIAEEEDLEYGDRDLEEMGSGSISCELVEKMADELSSVLKQLSGKKIAGVESKKKSTEDREDGQGELFAP
jgi:transposase